jgi:hypothetical protein
VAVFKADARVVMYGYLPEPALSHNVARTEGGNAAFHNFNNDYSHISDPNLRRRLALSEIDKVSDFASHSTILAFIDSIRYPSAGIMYER